MRTYYAAVEYYKATMETPWCLVVGERKVVANSEDEAKQAIVREAKMRGIDNISVTKITSK
jgi:hypothetical protein